MLKTWLTTLWQGIIGRSFRLLGRIWAFFPGGWIAGMVILFIGIPAIRVHKDHADKDRRQAIASAFGAANTFYGVPQINRDGSRLTYVTPTEAKGCALYLYDALTKQSQEIVSERVGLGYWGDDFDIRAWPWAPDDSAFIYSMMGKLVIYSSNKTTGPVELTVETIAVSQVVWLNPAKFAYIEHGNILWCAQKQANGQWQRHSMPAYDDIFNLTVIDTNTVAWLQDGYICHLNLDEKLVGTNNPFSTSTLGGSAVPPADGLTLWLDASKLRQPDQAPVMGLPDLSRSRNDAVWNGRPPVFNGTNSPLALNGQGTIHFGWVDSPTNGTGLKTRFRSGLTGSAPRSVFVVLRHEADRAMMVSMGDTSAHGALFGVEWSERLFLPTGWWADNYVDATSTNWNLLEVVYDGASQKGYLNGLLRCTASAQLNTVERGVEIGYRDGSDAKAADGDFAELLVYDRALGNAERRQVEDYLNAKWFGRKSLSPPSSLVWYDTGLDGMTGFSYSKSTGQLLISVQNGPDTTLWRCDSNRGMFRLPLAGSIQNARWIGAHDFAYIASQSGHKLVVLADDSGTEKSRLLEHGNVTEFNLTPDGRKMLFTGTVSNEPFDGIWQYDLVTRQLQSMVPYSDYPFGVAKIITPFRCYIRGSSQSSLIYPSTTIDRHKKYPLLIGDTWAADVLHTPIPHSAVANGGAFVAIVERGWWGDRMDQWSTNVMALCQNLKQDPAIDPDQIYLFGVSAETHYLSELAEKTPGLWKGLILFNPSQLPDFSKSPFLQRRPKILMIAGGEEHEEERFKRYQADSLKNGVMVEYVIPPGETHSFTGKAGRRERAEAVEHFIFEE